MRSRLLRTILAVTAVLACGIATYVTMLKQLAIECDAFGDSPDFFRTSGSAARAATAWMHVFDLCKAGSPVSSRSTSFFSAVPRRPAAAGLDFTIFLLL